MWKIIVTTLAAASAAYGLGLGMGVFGGISLPDGDTAAHGDRVVFNYKLNGGDAGSSPAFGAKALLEPIPHVNVEFAVGYHSNHKAKSWVDTNWSELPKLTLVPITAGGRYTFAFGAGGAYVGAGGGYFLEKLGLTGGSFGGGRTYSYYGEVDVKGPGAYVAGGLTYRLWALELEAGPRFTSIWNKGEYEYTYEATVIWPPSNEKEERSGKLLKEFNDIFIDVLAGVNYYFM